MPGGVLARFFTFRTKAPASPSGFRSPQLKGLTESSRDLGVRSPRIMRHQKDREWTLEDDEEEKRHFAEEEAAGANVTMFDEPDSDETVRFISKADQAKLPGGWWSATAATVAGERETEMRLIHGGTLAKLVQYATSEKYADREFLEAFIVAHRGFINDVMLMELIELRYVVHQPEEMDWKTFKRTLLLPIRLRCVNFVKTWLTLCPADFRSNQALLERTQTFISKLEPESFTAKNIVRVLDKALLDTNVGREFSLPPPPEPLIYESSLASSIAAAPAAEQPAAESGTSGLSVSDFLEAHPEEIARQIALHEWSLWQAIRPQEFINNAWVKPGKEENAKHIVAMIHASNARTNWVCTEILSHPDLKSRALCLNKFIAVAERSLAINNYNAVMEIFAALQCAPIHRLRQTWELLTPKSWETYDRLKKLWGAEGNWATLRETLRKVTPPCIPYLGFFLTDLTFINDGNPDLIPDTRLINFSKWRTVASVLKEIMRFQEHPMNFRPVRFVRDFLLYAPIMDPDQQWDKSVAIEEQRKKGAKDKKLVDRLAKEIEREEKRSRRLRRPGKEDLDVEEEDDGTTEESDAVATAAAAAAAPNPAIAVV